MSPRAKQSLVALGFGAAGLFLAVQVALLGDVPGYSQVGPRFFPGLVALGLIAISVFLLREAITGGYRRLPPVSPAPLHLPGFGWVTTGVVAYMVLIGHIGFVLASALLLTSVARGFGSRRWIRDGLVGLLAAAVVFAIFRYGLNLNLPSGLD